MIILDLMLPKLDGLKVCKRTLEIDKQLPIAVLTSKSEELDKVWVSNLARTTASPSHSASESSRPGSKHYSVEPVGQSTRPMKIRPNSSTSATCQASRGFWP